MQEQMKQVNLKKKIYFYVDSIFFHLITHQYFNGESKFGRTKIFNLSFILLVGFSSDCWATKIDSGPGKHSSHILYASPHRLFFHFIPAWQCLLVKLLLKALRKICWSETDSLLVVFSCSLPIPTILNMRALSQMKGSISHYFSFHGLLHVDFFFPRKIRRSFFCSYPKA